MAISSTRVALYIALLSIPFAYLYPGIQRVITVLGVFRTPATVQLTSSEDLVYVDGTIHCEDVHYHAPSHKLFTACEDSPVTRFGWFPPLAKFNASVLNQARGGLFVIDPVTKKAQKLELEKFRGPFVTHGIDVIPDPGKREGEAVYIFAVNHLPNPEFYSYASGYQVDPEATAGKAVPKARSQIEVFYHKVGSSKAQHIRSVWHPAIKTPNDIFALSPQHFLVTNDHYYREGLMREVEDIYPGAKWSNTLDIEVSDLSKTAEASSGVKVKVVVDSIHNNNGLSHGRTENEVLIGSAVGGSLHFGSISHDPSSVQVGDILYLDSAIDNPSYFVDPYGGTASSADKSGYVLAGLGRAIDLSKTKHDPHGKDPVVVWYAKKSEDGAWNTRLLFEDDSSRIRSASAAVLVAIDPAKEDGKRRAWL
ncbi:uncharacterized protein JN550_013860, partial [Neoarthrinium moseri]|uniref:uncharacterized protein n=1 Tax=Neoarthrinium moseri TaxID=1658444 RepID=UPI001FDD138F